MKNRDIDLINQWLLDTYGYDLLHRPYWRIVWSVGITEKRKGEFHDYYGPIFIRKFYGVREQPKYAYHPYWRERWILEKLIFGIPNPELCLDTPGSYEPIHVFYDENGNYIKPTLDAIKYFLFLLMEPRQKKSASDFEDEERKEIKKEEEVFMGIMEDKRGGQIASALRVGEAVINPGFIHLPDGKLHKFDNRKDKEDVSVNSSQPTPIRSEGIKTGTVSG